MLSPYKDYLDGKYILLASSSPRRKEILEGMGLRFSVRKSNFEENLDKSLFPDASLYVQKTALCKTEEVVERMMEGQENLPDIVIGADTVVCLEGEILEKPKDTEEAKVMLRKLNRRVHTVHTGVIIMMRKALEVTPPPNDPPPSSCDLHYDVTTFGEDTQVEFDLLSEDVIRCYAESGDSLDKAGAYGIQGQGGSLIKGVKGDYFNVVGLPANHLTRCLANQIAEKLKEKEVI